MKAIGFYKTGGPEVLQQVEVPDPIPLDNDIIVRVSNTSLNNLDVLMRSGATRINFKTPHITGTDIVGTVEKVGSNVKELSVGERVIASTIFGCGECEACRSGNEVLCQDWKVLGMHVWGSYGELVKIPSRLAIRPPKSLSDEELGCLPLCLSTSWRALNSAAKAKEGETVVIRGASGNVGILSIMLAKALGLRVIAFTRSSQKKKNLLDIGADHAVDYENNEQKAVKDVYDLTAGKGADIVIDPLGSTLNDSISMLRPGGRVVVFGTIGGQESSITIKKFYWKSATILGITTANRRELEEALEFVSKKRIRPIIARKMTVKDAQEAHQLFAESKLFGKISMKHEW